MSERLSGLGDSIRRAGLLSGGRWRMPAQSDTLLSRGAEALRSSGGQPVWRYLGESAEPAAAVELGASA